MAFNDQSINLLCNKGPKATHKSQYTKNHASKKGSYKLRKIQFTVQ